MSLFNLIRRTFENMNPFIFTYQIQVINLNCWSAPQVTVPTHQHVQQTPNNDCTFHSAEQHCCPSYILLLNNTTVSDGIKPSGITPKSFILTQSWSLCQMCLNHIYTYEPTVKSYSLANLAGKCFQCLQWWKGKVLASVIAHVNTHTCNMPSYAEGRYAFTSSTKEYQSAVKKLKN